MGKIWFWSREPGHSGIMDSHNQSDEEHSMEQEITKLLHECLPALASTIETETDKPITDFKQDSYPRLAVIDGQIPGVGMHYAIWKGATPLFPFEPKFDGIVRPLTYVPYLLASNVSPQMASRFITKTMGGHVEECIKEFCRTLGLKTYTPLGRWVTNNASVVGKPLFSITANMPDVFIAHLPKFCLPLNSWSSLPCSNIGIDFR